LMQVNHIKPRPFILLGKDTFSGLIDWMQEVPVKLNLMSKDDLRMINVVDTVDEVVKVLEPHIAAFQKLHPKQS
jgi:predicted Rossmann-fold nucleotide-binding protein